MRKLIILGAGGAGREVAQIAIDRYAARFSDWQFYGFLDDAYPKLDTSLLTAPLLGTIADWHPKADEVFICAIGNPNIRKTVIDGLTKKGAAFANVIHPTAIVSPSATLGDGIVVYPFTCISVNTLIGNHVMINMHNAIGHDAQIGDYCVLSSFCDITGAVKLGTRVFLGSHVTIAPRLSVGDGATLGIGSVVVTNIKSEKTVFGVPAKSLNL